MTETLTTLGLAELIAVAVIEAYDGHALCISPEPAQAVLRTLRETSHWLCRVEQDADGIINGDVKAVQLPLEMEP